MSREVPEGWRTVDLGDVAKESRARNSDLHISEERLVGVFKDQGMVPMRDRVRGASVERCKVVKPGDFAYNPMRINIGSIARSTADADLMVSPDYVVFSPDTNKIDGLFLDYLRKSDAWAAFVGNAGDGGVRIRIYFEHLARLRFNLPPLHEQRRIAEVLSSVDEAVAATRAVIEQARKVKQGVLERLLTKGIGHTRFKQTEIGEIPEGWGLCALAEVAKVKHGYAFSGEFFSKEEGPNILVTPGNFSKEKTLYFGPNTKFYQGPIPSDFILKNGDLLVVMTDLTPSMDILGNAVILNSNKAILHNQRIGKVEVDSKLLSASFLRHVLNSERVQKQIKKSASGTTVRHTSPGRILENLTALPPMEEQLSIVEALRTIDDALYLQIQNLERISSLKSALMSDLLTGRKRVTDALPMAAE